MFAYTSYKPTLYALTTLLLLGCGGGGGSGGTSGTSNNGARLTGAITIPSFSVIDSDINNSQTNPVNNSSIATAQAISNPASLGGYVNSPSKGSSGNSFINGDVNDYFKIAMKANQVISLNIAESNADLDLYLYTTAGALVASSTGANKSETIAVSTDGDYLINVVPINSASSYVLSIGLIQSSSSTTDADTQLKNSFSLDADFASQEIVIKKSAAFNISSFSANAQKPKMELIDLSLPEKQNSVMSEVTIDAFVSDKMKQGTTTDQQQKLKTLYTAKALSKRRDIEYAHPNFIRKTSLTPNDTYYLSQWHYPMINLPSAWDITTGSANVIVAVIDTGIYLAHEDLVGQLIAGYDFISNPARARDGNGIDPNPNDEGDGSSSVASSFHGTHVAGTISALTNNNKGVAGVSWNSKIMPIRVLGTGGGTDYDIAQGILYAAGLANDSNTLPAKKADIINLSLGGSSLSQTLLNAINSARAAGVIIVAAAGNTGNNSPQYPAAIPGVISVSALDAARNLAPYSSYGSTVSIAAPGGNINADIAGDGKPDGVLSTVADDSGQSLLSFYQGTSMAAPHVAGVLALMKSINSSLTPSDIDTLLQSNRLTQDIGATGKDNQYGYGMIDARKAVEAVSGVINTPAQLNVYPLSLSFNIEQNSQTIIIGKTTQQPLSITSITSSQAWLTIASPSTTFGSYTLNIDRSVLATGIHSANVTIVSNTGGTKIVKIVAQVGSSLTNGDVGRTYVLLINSETNVTAKSFQADSSNGQVAFDISDVPDGSYNLVAGTDIDNDLFICDSGEACGGYPTLNQLENIIVDRSKSNLNFVMTFLDGVLNISNSSASTFVSNKISQGQGIKLGSTAAIFQRKNN